MIPAKKTKDNDNIIDAEFHDIPADEPDAFADSDNNSPENT